MGFLVLFRVVEICSDGSRKRETSLQLYVFANQANLQELIAHLAHILGFLFQHFLRFQDFDFRDLLDQQSQHSADNEPGMGRAQAEMVSEAECDVRIRFPVEADFPGVIENRFIEISGSPGQRNPSVRGNRGPVNIGFDWTNAAEMC